MIKHFLTVFAAFTIICTASGQSVYEERIAKHLYESQLEKCAKIGLDSFFYTGNVFAFRMTTDNHVVEIWSPDSIKFYGRQICYSYTIEDDTITLPTYYSNALAIHPDTLKKLLALFPQYDLEYLPSQPRVEPDSGMTYMKQYNVEYFTSQNSFFRYYMVPFYDQKPRMDSFYEFAEKMESSLNASKKINNFVFSLPPDACYFYGSAYYICLKVRTITKKKG